jgi:DNA repair exonuclease SbcCD ATPase subunit
MNKNIFNDDFNKIYLQALESIESYKRDALTSDILLIEMFKSYGTTARYVLTEYFDNILNHANYRLKKMTNGRYLLYRKVDKSKGRS